VDHEPEPIAGKNIRNSPVVSGSASSGYLLSFVTDRLHPPSEEPHEVVIAARRGPRQANDVAGQGAMLRLAYKNGKLTRLPFVPGL